MKTSQIISIIIIIVLIGIFAWSQKKTPIVVSPQKEQTSSSSIKGCYLAGTEKDIYTLNINTEEGETVSGTLAFKNFEKDSSHGTFKGAYTDGILLGDYSFQSEGMNSVMQVIFKKSGDNFIRGYGDVDQEGTHFTNISAITYDDSSPLSVFKKGECASSQ